MIYKHADLSFLVSSQATNNGQSQVQFSTQDKGTAKLIFNFKKGREPISLVDITAELTMVMADDSKFVVNPEITKMFDGQLEYTLTPEQIRHHGRVLAEISLKYSNGNTIGGFEFSFNIKQAMIDRDNRPIQEFYVESFDKTIIAVNEKAAEITEKLDRLDEEYQNKAYTVDEKLADVEAVTADVQATVQDLRENGTGIDAQARRDVQGVSGRLESKTKGIINVIEKGAIGDGVTDDTSAIQSALDIAKLSTLKNGIKVEVPPGTYKVTKKLKIYRNTTLSLHKNARIIRGGYVSLLINGDEDIDPLTNPTDKYSGHGNIVIEGGIWDGNILNQPYANTGFNIFGFTRARDITIRNIEFRDVITNHAMDLNALENVLIDNCRFLGYKDATVQGDSSYPRDYSEAIQIANVTEAGAFGAGDLDGTPCKNVRVRDCYFGESGTPGTQAWPVGVGNHGAVHDKYVEDIQVSGCTFDKMTYAGIRNFKFRDTTIVGNTFNKCRQDITCSNPSGNDSSSLRWDPETRTMVQSGLPQAGSGMTIAANIFRNTKQNILWVRGQAKDTNIAKFDGIDFTGNTIIRDDGAYSTSNLIDLTWCKNVTIRDVGFLKCYRGIIVNNSDNVVIDGGFINDTTLEAVYVTELNDAFRNQGHTSEIYIRNLSIKNVKYNGIFINYLKKGKIENNVIENVATLDDNVRSGINVASSSDSVEIEGNTVKSGPGNKNKYGIDVTQSATNCRVGPNHCEGKTLPVNVAGATNWIGQYVYAANGTRYKATVSNTGAPVYTAG